jgi:hypothetical protein
MAKPKLNPSLCALANSRSTYSLDALFETEGLKRIRPRYNHDVAPSRNLSARGRSGPDPSLKRLHGNEHFASQMTASLGLDLVFDVESSDARAVVSLDRLCDGLDTNSRQDQPRRRSYSCSYSRLPRRSPCPHRRSEAP